MKQRIPLMPFTGIVKRLVMLALAGWFFLGTVAAAQTADAQSSAAFISEMQEKLGLTDEQVQDMQPILETSRQQQSDILANYGIDFTSDTKPQLSRRQAMSVRNEMKAVRQAMFEQLESVLTEEQLDAFAETQEAQADERRAQLRERLWR
ncbi:MAG: Spy/CpxP family protein refolding chaperone [Pseudomonadota bacterium]